MQSACHFGPGSSSSVLHLKLQGIYDIQDVRISITEWSDIKQRKYNLKHRAEGKVYHSEVYDLISNTSVICSVMYNAVCLMGWYSITQKELAWYELELYYRFYFWL